MRKMVGLLLASALLSGCGASTEPPSSGASIAAGVLAAKPAGQTLYAFSPGTTPLIVAYSALASGASSPKFALKGPNANTLQSPGSLGIDPSGAIYAIAGVPVKLLRFAPGASGTSAPEASARMPSSFIPSFAGIGFAMDADGNYWTTANHKLMRFPMNASGSTRPNLTIAPVLATPIGNLRATPLNVALDARGNVYCACEVVANAGAQASGISEYSVASGKVHLVRTFFDLSRGAEEIPPQSIAIDSTGAMYLAATQNHAGVRVYSAHTPSGSVHATRIIAGGELDYISAIALDSSNNLYVAVTRGIAVFGPTANGEPKPKRWIVDPQHLAFGDTGFAGTLLVIR